MAGEAWTRFRRVWRQAAQTQKHAAADCERAARSVAAAGKALAQLTTMAPDVQGAATANALSEMADALLQQAAALRRGATRLSELDVEEVFEVG